MQEIRVEDVITARPARRVQAELQMDETTKQVVKLLEQSIALQLGPLHEDLSELKTDFRAFREQVQAVVTAQALTENNVARLERQLNEGLAAVGGEASNKWKWLAPLVSSVAALVTALVMYLLRAGLS